MWINVYWLLMVMNASWLFWKKFARRCVAVGSAFALGDNLCVAWIMPVESGALWITAPEGEGMED